MPVPNAMMQFGVHQFVSYDVNGAALRANHDTSSPSDKLCAAMAVEFEWPDVLSIAQENQDRSCDGHTKCCRYARFRLPGKLLVILDFARGARCISNGTVWEKLKPGSPNKDAGGWAGKSEHDCRHARAEYADGDCGN